VGTRGPFPGPKAQPGCDTDHSPHLVPRSRMSRSYTSLPASMTVDPLYLSFSSHRSSSVSSHVLSSVWLMVDIQIGESLTKQNTVVSDASEVVEWV
jgi:hypothetical protein